MSDEPGLHSLPSDEFRDVIGHFASGVTVITALQDGRAFGTTASAVTSLSVEPPMVLICLNKTSETGRAISAAGRFAINILGEDQPDAAVRFAGKGDDKFAGVAITPGAWGEPLIDDALATLECHVTEETTGGTHWVFLAEVDHASARTGTPLAYFRGEFGRLELAQDEQAAGQIRALILDGSLAAGEPVDIDVLAQRCAVPRAPAYYALAKLAGEGLVVRSGAGAFQVGALTAQAREDALRARAAIEIGAAALRVGTLTADELAACRQAVGTPDFADQLVALAGSTTLLDGHRRIASPRATPDATRQSRIVDAYEAADLPSAIALIASAAQRGSSRSTFQ